MQTIMPETVMQAAIVPSWQCSTDSSRPLASICFKYQWNSFKSWMKVDRFVLKVVLQNPSFLTSSLLLPLPAYSKGLFQVSLVRRATGKNQLYVYTCICKCHNSIMQDTLGMKLRVHYVHCISLHIIAEIIWILYYLCPQLCVRVYICIERKWCL